MIKNTYEKILLNKSLNKALRNSGWLIFDKIASLTIGLWVGILLAKYLGPANYGQIVYAVTYVTFFQTISILGLDSIVVRDLSNGVEKCSAIISTIFTARFLMSMVCLIIAISLAYNIMPDKRLILSIISLNILFSVGSVFDLWFQSQSKSRLTICAKLISYIFCALVKVFMIYLHVELINFSIIIVIEVLLYSSILYFLMNKNYSEIKVSLSINSVYLKSALKESWPLMLSAFSVVIFMKSNILFIQHMLGDNYVGIYSVGANLAELTYFFPAIIVTSFLPILAKLKEKNISEYHLFFHRLMFFMWWGSIFIVIVFGGIGYFLIPYIYGIKFEQSKYIFIIHVITLIPVCVANAQYIWIINERRSKMFLVQTLTCAFLAITLNYFLIRKLGLIGAPVATLISQLFQCLILISFLSKNLFKITIQSLLWK
ncbi:TPA: flippase [Yersinia enterocolitica]